MKKPNELLAKLAQAKPVDSAPTPDHVVEYQPTKTVKKPLDGANKGIWLRADEVDALKRFRRKLYLEGLEVSQNLIIRALIQDLESNPRVREILGRLARG